MRELLEDKVELDVEGIDRIYLNAYQPRLQTGGGVVGFFREHRGAVVASTTLMAPMSKAFVADIHRFAKREGIEIVHFERGQRKDEETQRRLKQFQAEEGVLYIGVAQEKFAGFRVMKKISAHTGTAFPWLYRSTVMCNQYYFYLVDADFGPLFIKFSSYFPYTARICLNGHEYAKRQLEKAGIVFEALDNGIRRCEDPQRLQQILDDLDEVGIEAVVRKWFARLPHPFTAADRAAGYRYELSILQAEFARTQVFDRPLSGRHLFEEIIRENLDLGRPEQVSLIFERRITKRTPGRFATRVITQGVTPSLHISYKSTKIKQYFKEERALRTETTINNSRDFAIGRRLHNLPALRAIGFAANRRVLEVERISQDCQLGEALFDQVNRPQARRGAARLGTGLRRWTRDGPVPGTVPVHPPARGISQRHPARACRRAHGRGARTLYPGTHDLRSAPPAPPRPHRAHPAYASLRGHRAGQTRVAVLHQGQRPRHPPGVIPTVRRLPQGAKSTNRLRHAQLDQSCEQLFAEAKLAA